MSARLSLCARIRAFIRAARVPAPVGIMGSRSSAHLIWIGKENLHEISSHSPVNFGPMSISSSTQQAPGTVVPRLIKFSGTLLDEQGRAMRGPIGVTFELYAQQSGGAGLWIETQNVTPDASGNYAVLLGVSSANGVPPELFASGEARWLGLRAEQQAEQPRVLLVSVPYALKAGDAETLGGRPRTSSLPR
jgi:hypothetical protein